MSEIHQTAIIEPGAVLGDNVVIGPYCVVGSRVRLAAGVVLHSHVVVKGNTTVGGGTQIYPFASIGNPPQDKKYSGEESYLDIGRNNVIREYVTMNPGTQGGGLYTRIGDNCLFMASAHVAHDCIIGNNVILANSAAVAGHCRVSDFAILGGLTASHQFVRIGRGAFIGGMTGVEHDVIPFGLAMGNRAYLSGLNLIGLKRQGFTNDRIRALKSAYDRIFTGADTLKQRVDDVALECADNADVMEVVNFIRAESNRPICMPRPE